MLKNLCPLFIVLLLFHPVLYAQSVEKDLKEQIRKQDLEIQNLKSEISHLKENLNAQKIDIKELVNDDEEDMKEWVTQQNENLRGIVNMYVLCITIILGLIGFGINFFGKDAIKKRVESIIQDKAVEYAKDQTRQVLHSQITDDYVSQIIREKGEVEINKLITSLETKGADAISDIRSKADEAISAITSPPPIASQFNEDLIANEEQMNKNDLFILAYNTPNPQNKIQLYKKLLEIDPLNADALNNTGVAYRELGKFEEALPYYNKAIELRPDYSIALANRSDVHLHLKNFDEALDDVNQAIELNPEHEFAYYIKSRIYASMGNVAKAKQLIDELIEKFPESPSAHFNRGHLLSDYMLMEEAKESYIKAEQLGFHNKAMLYNNLAVLYRRLKEYSLAEEYIEKARLVDADFPNLDGTLALMYGDQGNEELFYKHLKIALDKNCQAWNYLDDPGFDKFRDSNKLKILLDAYKNK